MKSFLAIILTLIFLLMMVSCNTDYNEFSSHDEIAISPSIENQPSQSEESGSLNINKLFDIDNSYYSDDLEIVTEKVNYSLDDKVIYYSITNIDDEERVIVGDDNCFALHKLVDGEWKRVGTKNEHNWNSLGQILEPNQTEERIIKLEEYFYLPLEEGEYRISVEGFVSNTFEIS